MTNSLGNYSLNVNGFSGAFENYYNSGADDGPAGYDIKHNLSATGVYALPVGSGKEYFSSASRVVDEASAAGSFPPLSSPTPASPRTLPAGQPIPTVTEPTASTNTAS